MTITLIIVSILLCALVVLAVLLRRVVPTNMVHIVQRTNKTVPYGREKPAGNVYYEWPRWIPILGVSVTRFPESNFQVSLNDYDAYDAARLPFVVDVTAFFRINDAQVAAQRIATFEELRQQLVAVLQGAVRRILATNDLEAIMQERASLGKQFTEEVQAQIKEWGVIPVKTIEFMDLRDSAKARVIANIMSKEQSRIERESRVVVAENNRDAQLREIAAAQDVELQKQEAAEQVGTRTALREKAVGIAEETKKQEVLNQALVTTEKQMDVDRVKSVKQAEIEQSVAVIEASKQKDIRITAAQGERDSKVIIATGDLDAAKLQAQSIELKGVADGLAEQARLMAPVETQIKLAREIGNNEGYQHYLIQIRTIEGQRDVGIEMAKAIEKADLKVIANGSSVENGVSSIGKLLSAKTGVDISGLLAGITSSPEGKKLVDKVLGTSEE